jgi:hypothetical protein
MSSPGHAFTISAEGVICAPRRHAHKRLLICALSFAITATVAYDIFLLAVGL